MPLAGLPASVQFQWSGLDYAKHGPVDIVRQVGLPGREKHGLELVASSITAAVGACDGLPEEV